VKKKEDSAMPYAHPEALVGKIGRAHV